MNTVNISSSWGLKVSPLAVLNKVVDCSDMSSSQDSDFDRTRSEMVVQTDN